jgi:hypothetical protein
VTGGAAGARAGDSIVLDDHAVDSAPIPLPASTFLGARSALLDIAGPKFGGEPFMAVWTPGR